MTIRNVHLMFITISVLLAIFVAGWAMSEYLDDGSVGYVLGAVVSLVAAVALAAYGVTFRRKTRHW
jgi:hypothetical protein